MSSLPLPQATPEDIGLSTAGLARLGRVMQEEVQRGRVPGAVALVARRGQLGYYESFGQRDPVSGAPMARDSIFRIYSMTKPIVSVAAMMLWEARAIPTQRPDCQVSPGTGQPQGRGRTGRGLEAGGCRAASQHSRSAAPHLRYDL